MWRGHIATLGARESLVVRPTSCNIQFYVLEDSSSMSFSSPLKACYRRDMVEVVEAKILLAA